jgi:hypothetical protein
LFELDLKGFDGEGLEEAVGAVETIETADAKDATLFRDDF